MRIDYNVSQGLALNTLSQHYVRLGAVCRNVLTRFMDVIMRCSSVFHGNYDECQDWKLTSKAHRINIPYKTSSS